MEKICTRCRDNFSLEEFPIINKRTGKQSAMCANCKREYDRERYMINNDKNKLRKRVTQDLIRRRNRLHVVNYLKSHPCVDCGEPDFVVLEFDHQGGKEFNISDGIQGQLSIERIDSEIGKCDVVCANCHRRRSAIQFDYYSKL